MDPQLIAPAPAPRAPAARRQDAPSGALAGETDTGFERAYKDDLASETTDRPGAKEIVEPVSEPQQAEAVDRSPEDKASGDDGSVNSPVMFVFAPQQDVTGEVIVPTREPIEALENPTEVLSTSSVSEKAVPEENIGADSPGLAVVRATTDTRSTMLVEGVSRPGTPTGLQKQSVEQTVLPGSPHKAVASESSEFVAVSIPQKTSDGAGAAETTLSQEHARPKQDPGLDRPAERPDIARPDPVSEPSDADPGLAGSVAKGAQATPEWPNPRPATLSTKGLDPVQTESLEDVDATIDQDARALSDRVAPEGMRDASVENASSAKVPPPSNNVGPPEGPGLKLVGDAEVSISGTDAVSGPAPLQPRADLPPPDRAAPVHADMARQVAAQVADVARQGSDGVLEVSLKPEELGKLQMVFAPDGGRMMVSLNAERPETLDLIRRNLDMLATDLRDLGYENLSFSFGTHDDRGPDQDADPDKSAAPEMQEPQVPDTPSPQPTLPGRMDLRF